MRSPWTRSLFWVLVPSLFLVPGQGVSGPRAPRIHLTGWTQGGGFVQTRLPRQAELSEELEGERLHESHLLDPGAAIQFDDIRNDDDLLDEFAISSELSPEVEKPFGKW